MKQLLNGNTSSTLIQGVKLLLLLACLILWGYLLVTVNSLSKEVKELNSWKEAYLKSYLQGVTDWRKELGAELYNQAKEWCKIELVGSKEDEHISYKISLYTLDCNKKPVDENSEQTTETTEWINEEIESTQE